MLTIAGGILIAVGIAFVAVNGLYLIAQILFLPVRLIHYFATRKSADKQTLPVRHYEELPDYLAGSDNL